MVQVYKKNGTDIGDVGADANLVALCKGTAAKWILDEDGDTWQPGKITCDGEVNCAALTTLTLGTPTMLTIAGGAITITRSYHKVMAPGSPTDLNTINGGTPGQILVLESNEDATDIVVRDNTGNIQLEGNADCTLAVTRQKIYLFYDPGLSLWLEKSRFTG